MFHVKPSEQQLNQLEDYYTMLVEKNKVMNLTAITEPEEVYTKHFLDSISICQILDLKPGTSLLDLGTGAGFPGIPIKIFYPEISVTLMDSLNKRILFLRDVCDKLGLDNTICVHSRAEEAGKTKTYREQYDVVTSRAVANLSSLSEYCLPFVKCGGYFISYKSAEAKEEISSAGKAISVLGGKIAEQKSFLLPKTEIGRTLIKIKKIKPTPGRYPRKAGTPLKEPIS